MDKTSGSGDRRYDPVISASSARRGTFRFGSGKEGTVSQNYRGYCANGEEKPLAKGEAKAYLAGLQEFLGKIPADDAGRLFLLESSCI